MITEIQLQNDMSGFQSNPFDSHSIACQAGNRVRNCPIACRLRLPTLLLDNPQQSTSKSSMRRSLIEALYCLIRIKGIRRAIQRIAFSKRYSQFEEEPVLEDPLFFQLMKCSQKAYLQGVCTHRVSSRSVLTLVGIRIGLWAEKGSYKNYKK